MIYQIINDGAGCYPWKKAYTVLPVRTIGGEIVWFEKVFKRKVWVVWGTGFHMEPLTQYATIFELINYDENSDSSTARTAH